MFLSFFNHWYAFFSTGTSNFNVLGQELNALILVSFTFEKSSILQCRRLLPVAITNKNIIYLSVTELKNSVFLDLVLFKLYSSCYQLFLLSFFTVKLHCQVHVSEFFYPVEFNRAKKPTLEGSAWTRRLNPSSLSLFSFSELNKTLDTNEYNWRRVFIFLAQEL